MKIPNHLNMFDNNRFIIFVFGKQELKIYKGSGGEFERCHDIKFSLPPYSDNEGHFKVRSYGKTVRSGAVRESDDKHLISEFLKIVRVIIREYSHDKFDGIYISAPAILFKKYKTLVTSQLHSKIAIGIKGNYCNKHPIKLLDKFQNKRIKHNKIPLDPEANKIIKKSNEARKVIKGKPDEQ